MLRYGFVNTSKKCVTLCEKRGCQFQLWVGLVLFGDAAAILKAAA